MTRQLVVLAVAGSVLVEIISMIKETLYCKFFNQDNTSVVLIITQIWIF